MLGANVGTTLIVQVLSFDISRVAPLFILIGVMMFRGGGNTRTHDLGRVGIGLGLILGGSLPFIIDPMRQNEGSVPTAALIKFVSEELAGSTILCPPPRHRRTSPWHRSLVKR